VVQEPMGGQKSVVWLDNTSGDVWRWIDFKANLGLLSVVNSKTFENEHTHTRSSSSTNRVGCHETLDVFGVVYELSESVADDVHQFLSDGVVSSGEVVGSIFLCVDKVFRVEQRSTWSSSNVVNDGWFKINVDITWNVLSSRRFFEEGEEVVITFVSVSLIHKTSLSDLVFSSVLAPDGVSKLDSSLSDGD